MPAAMHGTSTLAKINTVTALYADPPAKKLHAVETIRTGYLTVVNRSGNSLLSVDNTLTCAPFVSTTLSWCIAGCSPFLGIVRKRSSALFQGQRQTPTALASSPPWLLPNATRCRVRPTEYFLLEPAPTPIPLFARHQRGPLSEKRRDSDYGGNSGDKFVKKETTRKYFILFTILFRIMLNSPLQYVCSMTDTLTDIWRLGDTV